MNPYIRNQDDLVSHIQNMNGYGQRTSNTPPQCEQSSEYWSHYNDEDHRLQAQF
jgi:hypothetical protein